MYGQHIHCKYVKNAAKEEGIAKGRGKYNRVRASQTYLKLKNEEFKGILKYVVTTDLLL